MVTVAAESDIDTVAAATTTSSELTGGSIYFETVPSGATIWLDNAKIGTSNVIYFSQKTGTLDVRIQKKGYEEYTGTVTVVQGERVNFLARLDLVRTDLNAGNTPATMEPTTRVTRKSTLVVPTTWPTPTPTPEAALDPMIVIGAAALGIGCVALWRR